MADLPYDPYADVDHQVNYNGHSPYIGIDRSSQGPYVQETENHHQFVNRMFSSRLAKRGKTLSFRGIGPFNLRSTCICLHLLLVLVHVVLFFVWWYHLEHRVIVPLSRSGNISSAIVVTSQLLVIVCARPVHMFGYWDILCIVIDIRCCAGRHHAAINHPRHTSQISNIDRDSRWIRCLGGSRICASSALEPDPYRGLCDWQPIRRNLSHGDISSPHINTIFIQPPSFRKP